MQELSIDMLKEKKEEYINLLKNTDFNVLRGSILERYKRCGNPRCKCAKGKGHGPKFYLSVSFPGRRPEVIYVSSEVKRNVEQCLENLQTTRHLLEEIMLINLELIKRKENF